MASARRAHSTLVLRMALAGICSSNLALAANTRGGAKRWPVTPSVVTPGPPLTPAGAKCGCPAVEACTCSAAVAYLQCVTPQCLHGCHACSEHPSFEEQCLIMQHACGDDLAIGCGHSESSCSGKWHQLADSVVGLKVNATKLNDDAYCGPHGKCIGALRIEADAYKALPGAWLQCGAPRHGKADLERPEDWISCGAAVAATGKGGCTLDMREITVEASEALMGACWLTAGSGGAVLTQQAHFVIENIHTATAAHVVRFNVTMPHEAAAF
eukprot:TRINITY_DN7827_c0_g2_i1.p2 TRINITY_DN7827_c0_g2~~TRINITY_DN7827_c0_g2_i1.p2  ORF type:complete len:270 (+),score=62.25 TRINITY_DN7827_c0_g2_i1:76-885(+)